MAGAFERAMWRGSGLGMGFGRRARGPTQSSPAGEWGEISRMSDVAERFQNLHEFIKVAKQNLNRNNYDYIVGATETETTLARNRASLDSIAFKPRILRNVQDIDTEMELY